MFEQAFRNIDDVLWKEAGCTTELDYTEQTSWLLFLKYLDGLEQDRATEAELEGRAYTYLLDEPYRPLLIEDLLALAAGGQHTAVRTAIEMLTDLHAAGRDSRYLTKLTAPRSGN